MVALAEPEAATDIEVPYLPLGVEEGAPWETAQIDFWESSADSPAFIGASRSGKTRTGCGKMLSNMLYYRETQKIIRLADLATLNEDHKEPGPTALVVRYREVVRKSA